MILVLVIVEKLNSYDIINKRERIKWYCKTVTYFYIKIRRKKKNTKRKMITVLF